jgi:flagellar biosynthesis/type III secretory pathway protein FliH
MSRRPIHLGHPGYTLRPIVVGFERIPRITDPARAREAPQLAVLSALAHPEAEIAEAAIAGFDGLSEADQKLYWDVILNGLPALVRQALEARMIKGYQYQSDFARKYYWQGHDEGLSKGLRQGHEEAREELRREIVALVSARLPGVRDELAGRLRDQPEAALVRITAELAGADDEDGVRAALDRVLGPWA